MRARVRETRIKHETRITRINLDKTRITRIVQIETGRGLR
jgi:hypothetical protein